MTIHVTLFNRFRRLQLCMLRYVISLRSTSKSPRLSCPPFASFSVGDMVVLSNVTEQRFGIAMSVVVHVDTETIEISMERSVFFALYPK